MLDWVGLCAVSLLISLLTAAGYVLYSGLLSDVTVLTGSPPIKKITFVYKFKKGPYQNCWQLFKESLSIGPKLSCIGVFYDDPKKKQKDLNEDCGWSSDGCHGYRTGAALSVPSNDEQIFWAPLTKHLSTANLFTVSKPGGFLTQCSHFTSTRQLCPPPPPAFICDKRQRAVTGVDHGVFCQTGYSKDPCFGSQYDERCGHGCLKQGLVRKYVSVRTFDFAVNDEIVKNLFDNGRFSKSNVPGPQCRCAVGSILSEGENKADEELLKSYEASGFKVCSFPEVTHVVTTSFPHRTFFSVLLGIRRVYPRLEHYIKERRLCAHPFLEIYREGLIQFMVPLARQGDFYVPEVRPAERRLEQEELHSDSEVSGADSNSECSSGSGVLLSDSRETSLAGSSVRSVAIQDQGDRKYRGRSSRGTSLKELDWEQTGGQQAEREERLPRDSNKKSPEAPEWWGAVGGEE